MMVSQTRALIDILRRRDSLWNIQSADAKAVSPGRRNALHAATNDDRLNSSGTCIQMSIVAALLKSPDLLGLLLSAPLVVLTSRHGPRALRTVLVPRECLRVMTFRLIDRPERKQRSA